MFNLDRELQIDDEMHRHSELFKELQDSPTDVNAIVARQRKDFTGEFFSYLTLISETYDSLEDRDGKHYDLSDWHWDLMDFQNLLILKFDFLGTSVYRKWLNAF